MSNQGQDRLDIVRGGGRVQRFTQDSPILPDVWSHFLTDVVHEDPRPELLIAAHTPIAPGQVAKHLRELAGGGKVPDGKELRFIYNHSVVQTGLSFRELVTLVLPLSAWWQRVVNPVLSKIQAKNLEKLKIEISEDNENPWERSLTARVGRRRIPLSGKLVWTFSVIGYGLLLEDKDEEVDWSQGATKVLGDHSEQIFAKAVEAISAAVDLHGDAHGVMPKLRSVYSVSMNRRSSTSLHHSAKTLKAKAACHVFEIQCDKLGWAVLDSGIDATHKAFAVEEKKQKAGKEANESEGKKDALPKRAKKVPARKGVEGQAEAFESRVYETYDFVRLKEILLLATTPGKKAVEELQTRYGIDEEQAERLQEDYQEGRDLDWEEMEKHIEIRHVDGEYEVPGHPHGTHVAGILGGDVAESERCEEDGEEKSCGICRDIKILDLRVLDDKGEGDEFTLVSAMQFVRYLRRRKQTPDIVGANISISIPHSARDYACGRTEVCLEAERLVRSGVVTVVAAGNLGLSQSDKAGAVAEGAFKDMTITDPGNTEMVITVGSTHRELPHDYGISFFSSRGPTGDGRLKPDVVAPGEKIYAPVPGKDGQRGCFESMDGTSMAAPHVSGAAALVMAYHPDLVGKPEEVKRILCETATDLGRERYFQGHGLVDVLRAIQSR
jgi:serine protease AprX